ncbi:MAG: glycoside hydrolase family 16 protein [Tessaracoccus sp.]|uniref:glycoside hydrolase family 16 protein n=1 Tax=Tessaracoccus sp. TaxID=1971211 RepID=UPI001EB1452A|nr:glycoside hydrolase family 16 protein [Tessaracoccus sp.]MBK7822186.1 glycoside hydrolase family 16 protein [Tessaracoccus sp.]
MKTTVSRRGDGAVIYATRTFEVYPSEVGEVRIHAIVDDGLRVMVNGAEVGRTNLPQGQLSPLTRASKTVREIVTFTIPKSVLMNGVNTISADTRVNYANSAAVLFDATVVARPAVAGSPSLPESPAVPPANVAGWGVPDWRDEFDGTKVDTTKWRVRTGDYQSYDEAMIDGARVKVQGGTLRIETTRLAKPVVKAGRSRAFSTGFVDTTGKLTKRYGRWEVRAKLPQKRGVSRGLWPAIWLKDVKTVGEIDLMESMGDPHQHLKTHPAGSWQSAVHGLTKPGGSKVKLQNLVKPATYIADDWHTWAVEWTPSYIRVFLDGVKMWDIRSAEHPWLKDSFSTSGVDLRINTQVGSDWMGFTDPKRPEETVLPATMQVDYVRYWEYKG